MVQSSDPIALDISGLSHSYAARKALDNVTFRVPSGRFTVLLGLNGAGKSTLFALATRLYDARSGTIKIFGHNLSQEPGQALRDLGIVFQSRTVDLDLTVMQNLLYHASLHGIASQDARARAEKLLSWFGLSPRRGEKVRSLSGGQMRRVEIARALLHRPRLLLLDEATVGLDVNSRTDIIKHVRRLVAEEDLAVLWATHLIEEVAPDDPIIVLHEGRVLVHGMARDVVAKSGTKDVKSAFAKLVGASSPILENSAP